MFKLGAVKQETVSYFGNLILQVILVRKFPINMVEQLTR